MSMTAGTQTDLTRSGRRQKKNYGILQCVMAYCKGACFRVRRCKLVKTHVGRAACACGDSDQHFCCGTREGPSMGALDGASGVCCGSGDL